MISTGSSCTGESLSVITLPPSFTLPHISHVSSVKNCVFLGNTHSSAHVNRPRFITYESHAHCTTYAETNHPPPCSAEHLPPSTHTQETMDMVINQQKHHISGRKVKVSDFSGEKTFIIFQFCVLAALCFN